MKKDSPIIELGTTPAGTAVYSWLDKPDPMGNDSQNYIPRFKVTIDFEPEDIEDWLANFKAKTDAFVEAKARETGKQYTPKQLWTKIDGKIRMVFHSNEKKDGGKYYKTYDSEAKETDRAVWSGSKLRVKVLGWPYAMAKDNIGISPLIGAIQVVEFNQGGGGSGKPEFEPVNSGADADAGW
jgi:hypothetical protein